MSTTVSHPLPPAQAHAIADLTGYEDAATLRWQQACVQAANTLTALPNGRYVNVRMERMRQGLELAQRGAVSLPEDGEHLSAVVRGGTISLRSTHGCSPAPVPTTRSTCRPASTSWRWKSTWERWDSCRPPHQSPLQRRSPCPCRIRCPRLRHRAPRAGPSAKRPPRSTSSSRSATWNSCSPCGTWTT